MGVMLCLKSLAGVYSIEKVDFSSGHLPNVSFHASVVPDKTPGVESISEWGNGRQAEGPDQVGDVLDDMQTRRGNCPIMLERTHRPLECGWLALE